MTKSTGMMILKYAYRVAFYQSRARQQADFKILSFIHHALPATGLIQHQLFYNVDRRKKRFRFWECGPIINCQCAYWASARIRGTLPKNSAGSF